VAPGSRVGEVGSGASFCQRPMVPGRELGKPRQGWRASRTGMGVASGVGGDRGAATTSETGGTTIVSNELVTTLWFKKFAMCGREACPRGLKYLEHGHQIEDVPL
jgi:hypothetical protein